MAMYYVQGGTKLYKFDTSGGFSELSLPSGVTIDSTKVGRFALLNRMIVFVNSPSINLMIDPDTNTVYPMIPEPPGAPPIIAAGSGSGLTGDYSMKETFLIKDAEGNVLSESPLGPVSNTVTLADKDISGTGAAISLQTQVNSRREYRTAASGSVYFMDQDVDGNNLTTFLSTIDDAGLALLPASPDLGSIAGTTPGYRIRLITSWKDRLWAVTDVPTDLDEVRFSDSLSIYKWPTANSFKVRPPGSDNVGVTAFLPRRDELLITRRDKICKITGSSEDDFDLKDVVTNTGCIAPDSAIVIRDVAYWLGEDGVYTYGPQGLASISADDVHAWFTTDTYFARSRFQYAYAHHNHVLDTYELHLSAVSPGTAEDVWVAYDLQRRKWLGPHKTGAFTPTAAALVRDGNGVLTPVMGSDDGYVHTMNNSTKTDGASTAIDFDVYTKHHSGNTPDIEKVWLQLSVISKIEAGGTLSITPYVGGLGASAGSSISHDLTTGRERLRRLGLGRFLGFRFRENTNAQDVTLYGYELPYFEAGRR